MNGLRKLQAIFQHAPWLIESDNHVNLPIAGMAPKHQITWAELYAVVILAAKEAANDPAQVSA